MPWPGAVCSERLGASPSEPAPSAPFVIPLSAVTVEGQVDAAAIVAELEKAVPRRVAERRALDVGGLAGRLSFQVDRRAFSLGLEGDALFVGVELRGDASLCKPLGLLGCVEYASCQPAARAKVAMSLLLDERYQLARPLVEIPITRRCTLTALEIDVTGDIAREADRQAAGIRARIVEALPDPGPSVESLWRALGTSVPVGLGVCARVMPKALVQSGPRLAEGVVSLALGVEGEVVIESPCGQAAPSPPLPSPRVERGAVPGVWLRIPLVQSWDEVGRAVARSLALAEPRAGSEVVHVTDVQARPGPGASEGGVTLLVTLAGRVCGQVALDARAVLSPTGDGFALTQVRAAEGEQARAGAVTPGLDLAALAAEIERRAHISAAVDVPGLPRDIDRITAALLGPQPDAAVGDLAPAVRVSMKSAALEDPFSAAAGLTSLIVARGDATARLETR